MPYIIKCLVACCAICCFYASASSELAETKQTDKNLATQNTIHHELLMCDMSAPDFASDCSDMGPDKLRQLAQLRFAPINCFAFPPEPECGTNPYQQVNFIVVYAASATVEHWRALKVGNEVDISQQPITPAMQQLTDNAQQIHQHYPVIQQYYSFTQQDDGSFINELGNIMDLAAVQRFTQSYHQSNDSFGDCQTALDYMHRASCSTAIKHWIRGVDEENNTPPSWWHNIIDSFAVQLGILQIGLNNRRFQSFSFTLRYRDGSRLVLTITPLRNNPGTPKIELDKAASHTSSGDSFTAYLASLVSNPGVNVSFQEARSIFAGTGCSNVTQIVGQFVTYLITTVTLPDGTSYISAVQKESSVPIESTRVICDTPGLPRMW